MTYDIRWVRDNPQEFDTALKRRGLAPLAEQLIELDRRRRAGVTALQDLQSRRNASSKEIGKAKASGDNAAADRLIAEVAELKSAIQAGEEEERRITEELKTVLAGLPNAPLADVPDGADESANVEYRRHGTAPEFDFEPRQHFEIGEGLGLMDFDAAARLAGSRFVVLKGQLSKLERSLAAFMLDLHTSEHGYTEVSPPLLVRDEVMFGTGQLPKFAEDSFATTDGRWLIPTSEVPLTNMVREQILDGDQLPLRFTALTPCFRSEAGSAGRDTRGMLRQHQFQKVELVSITDAYSSQQELERMLACAEQVLKQLGLHYRVMTLSSGDMGFAARKTYDIEAWLPGQNAYREISSCSVCGDFQALRMNARYRDGDDVKHVHTLNGSGVATGRALIAVLENYQNDDGSVSVPSALRPYMGGTEKINATSTNS